MTDSPEIAAARIEAARARMQLVESVRAFEAPILELKNQLTPSHLMADAWDAAKAKGADIAEDAVDAVRSRPLTTTGVVAAIALFLAREPLIDLAGKLVDGAKRPKPRSRKKKQGQTETVNE
jgi:hypothetical protein